MLADTRESFAAQDAVARAAGLDWHTWAAHVLEAAVRVAQAEAEGEQGQPSSSTGRLVGAERGRLQR
jgi:hypothetical protein